MIYVFLAEGFEEIEAISTIDILRRCGLVVVTVSITNENRVCGAHNIPIVADALIADIDPHQGEAFVLPGGMPGSDNLQNCQALKTMMQQADAQGKVVAAICAAPKVLGAFGLLEGHKATCFPGFEAELLGATYVAHRAVRDENVITSRGAGTAADFGFFIAEAFGKDAAKVRASMLYDAE